MNNILDFIPKLPVAHAVEELTVWITQTFAFLFNPIQKYSEIFMKSVTNTLLFIPPVIFILLIAVLAFFVSGKKIWLSNFFSCRFMVHLQSRTLGQLNEYSYLSVSC